MRTLILSLLIFPVFAFSEGGIGHPFPFPSHKPFVMGSPRPRPSGMPSHTQASPSPVTFKCVPQ